MARREAVDIYTRAYRAWLHGQGRFLLGITHFMLINDYYVNADAHNLDIDKSGMEMMLRGALEYDHDIETWWKRLNDNSRRLVALHALLSENAPARVRALAAAGNAAGRRTAADSAPGGAAASGRNQHRRAAGGDPRAGNARQVQSPAAVSAEAELRREIDDDCTGCTCSSCSTTSATGARASSRRRSTRCWRNWRSTTTSRKSPKPPPARLGGFARRRRCACWRSISARANVGALRALALVRDEAPSLPNSVSRQARLYTWLNNTWRRITDQPMRAVWRYLFAAIFAAIAVWWYAYSEISSAAIFFAERWGKSLTTGITFGVVFGLVVLLAAEIPERLRGFWPWWARLLLSLMLGL